MGMTFNVQAHAKAVAIGKQQCAYGGEDIHACFELQEHRGYGPQKWEHGCRAACFSRAVEHASYTLARSRLCLGPRVSRSQ